MNGINLRLIFICLFGLVMLRFQCGKDVAMPPLKYDFSESLNLYPLKDLYETNDTLWIELSKMNKELFDSKTSRTVALDSGIISFGFNLTPLYDAPTQPGNSLGDLVFTEAGRIDSFNYDVFKTYLQKQCAEPNFHFKIGFVPKHRGYYVISVGSNGVFSCGDTSGNALFANINYRFNIINKSKSIYLQIPNTIRKQYDHTWLGYGFDANNVYVFKVQ